MSSRERAETRWSLAASATATTCYRLKDTPLSHTSHQEQQLTDQRPYGYSAKVLAIFSRVQLGRHATTLPAADS